MYDGLGRLTSETKGEDSIAYTYDANGNRIGMNQNGTVTTYAYDANNRLLSETVGDTATAYTYDANGNLLTTMTQVESAHSFEDGVCRRCEDWQTYRLGDLNLDGEISLADVLEILKLNSGSSSAQASMDLYSTASLETISAAGAADLNSNGVLDTEDYMLFLYNLLGDDLVSTSLYAAEGQTDDAADEWAAFADLDGNGIIEVADYNIALAIMSAPTPRLTDRMAHMIADVNGDGVVNTADAVDLTNYLNNAGSSYPINTIVSNTTLCSIAKAYTYNARNQQTHFNTADVSASYAYNPSGLRKAKTVGGSTKYFVYNGMNIVYEYSESVADGVTYFYGLNRTHNSDGEIYLYNAHGDVVQLVKNNAVVASYTYDAFGNLTSQIGNSENPFLYCGEYYDTETQTYYLRARYYNPANGRFNAEDTHWNLSNMLYEDSPVKLNEHEDALGLNRYTLLPDVLAVRQSSNRYMYCVANPIGFVDWSGNVIAEAAVIGGAVVTSIGEALLFALLAGTAVVATAALVDTVSTAISIRKTDSEKEKVVAEEKVAADTMPKDDGAVYYHVTTKENAAQIMASGTLIGSEMEGGHVFAWKRVPNKAAIRNSGLREGEVIIEFQTHAAFENDWGIEDPKIRAFGPVRSVFGGPVRISNIRVLQIAK